MTAIPHGRTPRRTPSAAGPSPATPATDPGANRPASAASGLWFAVALTAFEVGASIAIFQYAHHHGASDVGAYLYACLAPVLGAAVYFLRSHDVSGASLAIFAFNGLSAVVAVIGHTDARTLLYKDCFVTGLIGLIFLGSLLASRPLCYHFGQRFAGGGTREGDAWWAAMWDAYPSFRRSQRQITVVWAVIFIAEAVVKALAIRLSDYSAGFVWTQVLPIVAFALGIVLTMRIARQSRAAGERRRAEAQSGLPAEG